MPERLDPGAELRRTRLFADLEPEEMRRLTARAEVVRYRKGEALLRSDDPVRALLALARGWVKLTRPDRSGKDAAIWLLSAPEFPGLAALLGGRPSPGDYVAMEDSAAIRIPAEDFEALLARSPAASRAAAREAGAALRDAFALSRDLYTGRIEARIAALLLWFGERIGVREADGVALHVPARHRDLAEVLGTTVGTVIRTMRAWRRRGIVDYARARIALRDPEALARIAGALPAAEQAAPA